MTIPFELGARGKPTSLRSRTATRRSLPDPREQPTVTVEEAALILGVSRATAYAAARDGTIVALRIGRRLVIPTARLIELLEGGVEADRTTEA